MWRYGRSIQTSNLTDCDGYADAPSPISQAVRRSLQSLRDLDQVDERVTFHLLTTDDKVVKLQRLVDKPICLEAVPAGFRPTKARFKARSLEWFRLSRRLGDSDWVLHLDEETIIDQYALSVCINFIEQSTFQIGQVSPSWMSSQRYLGQNSR